MHFTKEEKSILITILAAALLGIIINVFTAYKTGLKVNKPDGGPVLISINSAAAEELEELPGIGAVTAQRIVKYREVNGKFKDIGGLKEVKGITQKKFDKLRQYITL
jgi:comEA protein